MKLGYSLLLGEYIKAEYIDYDDFKFFQIVCPVCKEPVFKVVRADEHKPVNYLSHYKSNSTYIADCELRVNAIDSSTVSSANSESRNQFLKYFLAVLREIIIKSEYNDPSAGKHETKAFLTILNKSKALAELRGILFDHSAKEFKDASNEELNELFDSYIEDITMDGSEGFKTQFSIDTNKRIASDIWRHLLTAKARPNYDFLFNHGFTVLKTRLENAKEDRNLLEWEEYMYTHMIKIIKANKNKAYKLMNNLKTYPLDPPHTLYPSNIFAKLLSEITHEMLGCLLRLPYFDILKNQKEDKLNQQNR